MIWKLLFKIMDEICYVNHNRGIECERLLSQHKEIINNGAIGVAAHTGDEENALTEMENKEIKMRQSTYL